jgi:hypothetical protein
VRRWCPPRRRRPSWVLRWFPPCRCRRSPAAPHGDIFPLSLSSLSYLGFDFSVSSHGFKLETLPWRKGKAEA